MKDAAVFTNTRKFYFLEKPAMQIQVNFNHYCTSQ